MGWVEQMPDHEAKEASEGNALEGGEEVIAETFRAVQDVCRWWP
jgi:hypothetical protein